MKHSAVAAQEPRYIKLNARDNVAIVVNDFGLPAGSRFACGLELKNFVPQGGRARRHRTRRAGSALWRGHRLRDLAHWCWRVGRRVVHPHARSAFA